MALGLSGVFRGTTTDFDQKHAFLENRRLAGGSQRSTAECGHSRAVASPQGSKASVCLVLRHVSIRRDIAYPFFWLRGRFGPLRGFGHFVDVICPRNERISTRSRRHDLKKGCPSPHPRTGFTSRRRREVSELLNWIVFEKPQPKLSKNSQIGTNSGLQPNGAWLNLTAKQLFSVRI